MRQQRLLPRKSKVGESEVRCLVGFAILYRILRRSLSVDHLYRPNAVRPGKSTRNSSLMTQRPPETSPNHLTIRVTVTRDPSVLRAAAGGADTRRSAGLNLNGTTAVRSTAGTCPRPCTQPTASMPRTARSVNPWPRGRWSLVRVRIASALPAGYYRPISANRRGPSPLETGHRLDRLSRARRRIEPIEGRRAGRHRQQGQQPPP